MNINNHNQNINFQAKFLDSRSLRNVVEYSIEHGKFDKLNLARKNIDKTLLTKRIKMDIIDNNGYPSVIFTKYEAPKDSSGMFLDEFVPTRQIEFTSGKKMNPLKYALEKILKLSKNKKMFENILLKRDKDISRFILDIE